MPRLLSILAIIMLCAFGCARNNDGTWKAPLVYRIDVQQGNVVDQQMINKLKPGMDKKQVKFIMGTPLIIDPFHNNRWDYLYSFEPGKGEREQRRITLYFNGEQLARIEGDIKVTDRVLTEEEPQKERSVAVPLEDDKPGFFKRMFSRNKKSVKEEEGGSVTEHETTATGTAATESGTTDDKTGTATTETQEQTADEPGKKTDTTPDTTPGTKETSTAQSTAGDTKEKNLLRRFWDRMTKGGKSDVEQGEESEQDRRDAEVLKGAGGDINQ